jgi:hypothetical protein
VINDSVPWKEELLRVAARLEKKKSQPRWTERSGFVVERDVMVSAYAIRKLEEARKISDASVAGGVFVARHALVGKVPDIWSRHEIWNHYDLGAGENVQLSLIELCNQFIHSWIWMLNGTENGKELDGIFVSSDRGRRRCLYYVRIDVLIELFREIGSERIVDATLERDAISGEMRITNLVAAPRDTRRPLMDP